MCKALIFISEKKYFLATEELNYLIKFLENNDLLDRIILEIPR